MSKGEIVKAREKTHDRSLAKGMLAGLIGGVVAAGAKSVVERVYRRRDGGREPLTLLAERVSGEVGHELTEGERAVALQTIHLGFGAVAGAAYGGAVEYFPAANAREGAAFGMALASLKQGTALPGMRLFMKPAEQTWFERRSEMVTYVVYGLITETVRRVVRKQLG
jgi:putative membrane protein